MNNYLEQYQTGIIKGIKVQCLPVNEMDAPKWQEFDDGICVYYNCPFHTVPCLVPCTPEERPCGTSVYFKKVE